MATEVITRTPLSVAQSGSTIGYSTTLTFKRPNDTTAYGAEDVVGPFTTGLPSTGGALRFANMGPVGGGNVILQSTSLLIDSTALIGSETTYRLYFYNQ